MNMSLEQRIAEAAAFLRAHGCSVEHIADCKHDMGLVTSTGWLSSDGSSETHNYCRRCGKSWYSRSGPIAAFKDERREARA